MSILDRSIRSLDSCDEALEEDRTLSPEPHNMHRVCSQDTLDDSQEILDVNPVCYSTDNLLAATSMRSMRKAQSEDGLADYDPGSRERLVAYEVNYHTDSEDDDDVYEPDWKVYEDFTSGVVEDQQDDVLPIHQSLWMRSTDKLAMDATEATEWDLSRRMGRKRHYRFGEMSSDLEDLVKQLEVIPTKIRRLDK